MWSVDDICYLILDLDKSAELSYQLSIIVTRPCSIDPGVFRKALFHHISDTLLFKFQF